ncbi:MAG TPA: hypothetical protein VK869_11810, partial [Rubrobacteraceae bacterium]|nr:hypothetical protein [Rubrobacteraceae bacterium]
MLPELIRALPAAVAVGVLPGWFWARVLWPARDPAERLAYSVAFSFALVPASALLLARLLGSGVTLLVAIASVLVVFVGGLGAYLRFGAGALA